MNIFSVTFVVFLILKLVGVIDWSWWWIASPIWIAFLIGIFIGFIKEITKSNKYNY
jgi:hypothetical protein